MNREPKPDWLKVKLLPDSEGHRHIKQGLRERGLYTVCEEAKCPNLSECWSARTATVMILGDTCTRACRFCNVKTGNPKGFINPEEIANTAQMARLMSLRYIVITSVDRDDLEDHGSGHFAAVVRRLKSELPELKVETLIPDFAGIEEHMHTLAQSDPFVIAQNLETVRRLTHPVRDRRAGHDLTLQVLAFYKRHYPHIHTKSSLMLGLGEEWAEVLEAMDELRAHGVDILTLGQYLRPTTRHLPVVRYYKPQEFEHLKEIAYSKGFRFVASGPLVRSSYKASDYLEFLERQEELALAPA